MSDEKIIFSEDIVLTRKMVEVYDVVVGGSMFQCATMSEAVLKERIATHLHCDKCGMPAKKPYLLCENCRREKRVVEFNALPEKEWVEKDGMIYSKSYDKYYSDWDEFYCDFESSLESTPDLTIDDYMLVIAKPVYPSQIDSDFFCDEMPENMDDLPDELKEAIHVFNETVTSYGPLSYEGSHSKIRVKIPQDLIIEIEKLKQNAKN